MKNIKAILSISHINQTRKPNTSNQTVCRTEDATSLYKKDDNIPLVKDNFTQSYFRDMIYSVSLPGLKIIGQLYKSVFQSYFWVFLHGFALLFSYIKIMEEYNIYLHSSVTRTVANYFTLVDEVPFPAITMCLPDSFNDGYDFAGSLEKCFLCNIAGSEKCKYS